MTTPLNAALPPALTPTDCTATLLHQSSNLLSKRHHTNCNNNDDGVDNIGEGDDKSSGHEMRLPSPTCQTPNGIRSRSSTLDSTGCLALNRIEYIEINKKIRRDGVRYYVVDVYKHRNEHLQRASDLAYNPATTLALPKLAVADLMLRERESNYQVEHRFDAFRELKNALLAVANKHADQQQCQQCHTLGAYLAHKENQSWTIKRLLKSRASRQALLSRFLNGVLSLTSEVGSDNEASNRLCLANEEAIELVERFLRRQHARSLGII